MSIFVFHSEQARRAISSGVKVFSKTEYSEEAIRELKAWNKKFKGKPNFIFVD